MHQLYRQPLGGQQLQYLRQLRDLRDNDVREKHLKRQGGVSASLYDTQQPRDVQAQHTVDAIVEERLQNSKNITSARGCDKISAARQTERSEKLSDEMRQPEMSKTWKIIGVRRRGGASNTDQKGIRTRRIGKVEAEWMEKQLQYKTRVLLVEKECRTAADVNNQYEELEMLRVKERDKMRHHLRHLSKMVKDVQLKVEMMATGNQCMSELQETIDSMEKALARFREDQLQRFEESVLEEKVLGKALAVFMEKLASWEDMTSLRLNRGTSSAVLKPGLGHIKNKTSNGASKKDNQSENKPKSLRATCSSNQEEDQAVISATSDDTAMVNRVRCLNEAIIRSGGLDGGWDAREHCTFVALLSKCGLTDDVLLQHLSPEDLDTYSQFLGEHFDHNHNEGSRTSSVCVFETRIARFLHICMQKIVTQPRASVRSHLEWYFHYIKLVEEKKHMIQEWKKRKHEERKQLIHCDFIAENHVPENASRAKTADAQRDKVSQIQNADLNDKKKREETEVLLVQWKQEKKQKEIQQEQRNRELQIKRDALEAKRRQEQLDTKQKVLLYKLQKEQEAMTLDCSAKSQQKGATSGSYPHESMVSSSPTPNEELVARSHKAIESAKAKRLRLQRLELQKQKRLQLPRRPEPKVIDENVKALPKPAVALNATAASRARDLSKQDIQRNTRRRERQSAHDAYFPGIEAIPDVKIKSFGHIPIQPRATPAWRKNI
ncbi:uncharacterized protein PHALS_04998 [Plasmopara halstedii]|uniref:Uncharacterized protein n=1 Tax=Plasmopara halstedii TaxID=4781 RepID=A0A0P1A9K4_PLAHL|nr:uncharacterized protein PHALS_04998 [Plasmopara halstedii]CEG37404.1 hypothetical protein PHALS_04998 [Plasmopara halstedii]|eukprot:XP_024573773.1 hypothetical protein PHALS_04998 [Plasmopara halstedii]